MEGAALSGEAAAELLLAAGSRPASILAASERNAT
jgi:hypothetical protein